MQAPLAQITWYHNIALLEKLDSQEERLWYARQAMQNGWSRNVLVHQMEAAFTAGRAKRGQTSTVLYRHLSQSQIQEQGRGRIRPAGHTETGRRLGVPLD